MLTIHYSPNCPQLLPDNVPSFEAIVAEHGIQFAIANFPTSGDITTTNEIPELIAGNRIRCGKSKTNDYSFREYHTSYPQLVEEKRFCTDGSLIEPLIDSYEYPFHLRFHGEETD